MKPFKGMYKDCNLVDQPEGTYREAQNILYNKLKDSLCIEDGTISKYTLNETEELLGKIQLPSSELLFIGDFSDGEEIINVYEFDGTTLGNSILEDRNNYLNLSPNYPIKGTYIKNNKDERIILFIDGNNVPRLLNIDTPQVTDVTLANLKLLNLFPEANVPYISNIEVNDSGGSILSGSYAFALGYELDINNTTNYFGISNFVNIVRASYSSTVSKFTGNVSEVLTSKSIKLTINNIDVNYDKLVLSVIKYINGNITVEKVGSYTIKDVTKTIIYTGSELTTDLLIEEIIVPNTNYTKPKAITYSNKRVYLANMEVNEFPKYQEYANDITSKYIVDTYEPLTTINNTYGDGGFTAINKSFHPDEVYAFYISFKLKTGGYSPAFHIPGRVSEIVGGINERALISDLVLSEEFLSEDASISNDIRYFHTRSTGGPNGKMGYWENQNEVYPDDFPDFNGQNVRHHKFPSLSTLLDIYPEFVDNTSDPKTLGLLGIKFENIVIPQSIKDISDGYEIFYAKRTIENSTIVGQSLTTTYSEETSNGFSDIVANGYLALHSPDLMINESYSAVSPSFIKNDLIYLGIGGLGTSNIHTFSDIPVGSMIGLETNVIRKVPSSEYVPYSNTYKKESCFKVQLSTELKQLVFYEESGEEYSRWQPMLCSIVQYKTDAYLDFTEQSLVSTGKISLNTTTSIECYGGDVYHTLFSFKMSPEYINDFDNVNFKKRNGCGVYQISCFSKVNCQLRQRTEIFGQTFYPYDNILETPEIGNIDFNISWGDAPNDNETPDYYDNYFVVNTDYLKQNELNNVQPKNDIPKITKFNNLIIQSNPIQYDSNGGAIRTFLPLNYYETAKNKGAITNLESSGKLLIIHHEDSIYRTVSEIKFNSEGTNVVLGSGQIFDIEPEEIISVSTGYAGTQHNSSCLMTKAGYFFIDEKRKKVFLMNEGLEEISNYGMKNWFNENLGLKINEQLKTIGKTTLTGNNPNSKYGVGYSVVFDDKYNRIIFSKRDFTFDNSPGSTIEVIDNVVYNHRVPLYAGYSEQYNQSFTVSYNIENKSWSSFHTYYPQSLFTIGNNVYSYYDNNIYLHNISAMLSGCYYNGASPSYIDFVFNQQPNVNKLLQSIELSTVNSTDKSFEKIRVLNSKQCSDLITLKYNATSPLDLERNVVYMRGKWNINSFHDIVTTGVSNSSFTYEDKTYFLDTNLEWYNKKKFIDKYNVVRLQNDNTTGNALYLSDIDVKQRISQF